MKKAIIVSFLILLLGLIFLQVGVLPRYTTYRQLHSQLEVDKQTLTAKKEYYSQLFTLQQKIKTYQSAFAKTSSALPPYADAADIYRFVLEKAGESGLVVQTMGGLNLNPGKKEGEGIIEFSILVEGDYSTLSGFLKAVENSSRLINVKTVQLEGGKGKEGEIKVLSSTPSYSLVLEANYASAF